MSETRPRCKNCGNYEKKNGKDTCKKFSTKKKDYVIDPEAFARNQCFKLGKKKLQTKV